MTQTVRALLADMVSPEALMPEGELKNWRTAVGEEGIPEGVVAPASDDEMAHVLARASEEGWTVLPAGLGTWLAGGGPASVTLVVSTRRMKQVHQYEPADLTFTAGAGLTLSNLREVTEPHGQWLPLDPPGSFQGSLGAAVATGTGGPLRHLYGTPRDHVLGLTLVSGDGRILRWGGRVVKNVAGFDVTRLSIGSWGSLGVVTSVSARLFPIPETDVTLIIQGPDLSTLLPLARAMALSPLPLAAVELMDALGPGARGSVASKGQMDGPALVLRLLGSKDQVAEMEVRIRSDLSRDMWNAQRLFGQGSRALHETLSNWEQGADLVARLCLLPSEMGVLLEEAEELRTFASNGPGSGELSLSGSMSDGVLRVALVGLTEGGSGMGGWASLLQDLRGRLEERGGSLNLSSGPNALMRSVGAWGVPGRERGLMEGLKACFDPNGILAPGRLGL